MKIGLVKTSEQLFKITCMSKDEYDSSDERKVACNVDLNNAGGLLKVSM